MRLEGKVALISGGARGMGAVEAKLFATEGAKVVIGDVLEAEAKGVEAEINESGGECVFIRLDVTAAVNWQAAVDLAVGRFGRLDILVNNAGISNRATLEDTSDEAWDRMLDINAKGVFLGTRHAIPAMRDSGGGSIINISSIYGLIGSRTSAAYHASKGAVRLLTKATAIQHASENIRCNSVHPGFIQTPMTEVSFSDEEHRERLIANTPLGRVGVPEDIAKGVLYLASDESSYVTGAELVIDGGFTAQ